MTKKQFEELTGLLVEATQAVAVAVSALAVAMEAQGEGIKAQNEALSGIAELKQQLSELNAGMVAQREIVAGHQKKEAERSSIVMAEINRGRRDNSDRP